MLRPDHDVVVVTSGGEAQKLLEKDDAFDLIFCDMMMPEVTGMDLFEWVQEHRAPLAPRMVFMTGGGFTPRASEFLGRTTNPVLHKPFDPRQVKDLLSKILG